MASRPEYDLTFRLFRSVADQLEPEERAKLLDDQELIGQLLELGPKAEGAAVLQWIQDAHYD